MNLYNQCVNSGGWQDNLLQGVFANWVEENSCNYGENEVIAGSLGKVITGP